jgi:hypothetical protein
MSLQTSEGASSVDGYYTRLGSYIKGLGSKPKIAAAAKTGTDTSPSKSRGGLQSGRGLQEPKRRSLRPGRTAESTSLVFPALFGWQSNAPRFVELAALDAQDLLIVTPVH